MSSTESVDPELVEETKQQIRALVNEIAELSQSEISEAEFYDGFLTRVVTALAAHGGVVWDLTSGRFQIAYQINVQDTGLPQNEEAQRTHGVLLRKLVDSGEPMLVQPQSGGADEDEGGNPTEFLLVLGLLRADQEIQGVVEVFQRPGTAPATQRGYLRFLIQMCDLAGDYLKTRSLRKLGHRQTLWNQVAQFTRAVHRTLDPRISAYAVANEGRRLIDCDRVTVAVQKGSKCKIEAVSGQDTFDKRANTIVLLEKLANAVVRQGDPVWYTGDTRDMPPQVEEAVQAYVDESHSKTVAILPLRREIETDESETRHDQEPIIGVLVVEQIEDAKPREGMAQRVDVVAQHAAMALANAVEHNSLFLMPLWRAIGRSRWVVQARTLPKTVTITLAALALILAMCLVPMDYAPRGDATLQPVKRQDVFATVGGTVKEVHARPWKRVQEGEILVVLENIELQVQIKDFSKQLNETQEQMLSARRQLQGRVLDPTELSRIQGELAVLQKRDASLTQEIELLREKEKLLIVRSPMDGVVTTFDVHHKLKDRPVEASQVLLSVAEPKGQWELEIDMPENRIGDVAEAQQNVRDDLTVNYVLATDPKTTYEDRITEVAEIAEVQGEEGASVKIKVRVENDDLKVDDLRPGTTAKAKVYCGRRSIGYVVFQDPVNFVYSRLIFPYF